MKDGIQIRDLEGRLYSSKGHVTLTLRGIIDSVNSISCYEKIGLGTAAGIFKRPPKLIPKGGSMLRASQPDSKRNNPISIQCGKER